MDRLFDNLKGSHGSYILPLFWQHGESEEIIREEIAKINMAGIYEFCVESRPFEDFCGEGWWRNMDAVIDECRRRNMRVWIFDDKHFPTGYANGALEERYPRLRKWHLIERNMDVYGPQKEAAVILSTLLREEFEETIVAVTAMERSGEGESLTGRAIDLTGSVKDGMLYFDVPEGVWRVFVFIKTRDGVEGRSRYMIDDLNPKSCRLMLSEVYEPHYKRYAHEFGKTIAGFFTDEPGFRNLPKGYDNGVGVAGAAMPWNDSLIERITEASGLPAEKYLAALWYDCGEVTRHIRCGYMDIISRMYSENFCQMLGDWCRARGVEYIGHILEDMNVSSRLGPGAGHYFRALSGQDMSGIDAVYHQIMPGFGEMSHAVFASTKNNDPEFYDFALGKLGASMAHIQSGKKGRALCEVFGGYGWAEGLPMMKWLADHFLAAGINRFVPHAFSPKEWDEDCPPHLYGRGHNPQYPYLKILMDYMNRMCHIFSGGKAVVSAGVIYHAEAEWCGGEYMYEQKPLKELLQGQLDCDIIPFDALSEGEVEDGAVVINETVYPCIVAPYAQILPREQLALLENLAERGADIVFADALPEGFRSEKIKAVPLSKIREYVKKYADVTISSEFKNLRVYHYRREGADYYILNNEGVDAPFCGEVRFSQEGACGVYDPVHNRLYRAEAKQGGLQMRIEPYRANVVVFGDLPENIPEYDGGELIYETLDLRFRIEVKEEGGEFRLYKESSPLINITGKDELPKFCGQIRYTADIEHKGGQAVIDLGEVGEIAELYVNGELAGTEICPPYRFSARLKQGRNQMRVIVTNNPAYRERDKYSRFIMLKPSGLMGPVRLANENRREEDA